MKEKQDVAKVKASEAQAIADDAQKDLDEAMPALEAALSSLKSLNKNDVVEVGRLFCTFFTSSVTKQTTFLAFICHFYIAQSPLPICHRKNG